MILMAVLFLLLSGCANVTTQLTPVDPTVKAAVTGSDCIPMFFGIIIGTADMTKAMFIDGDPYDVRITRVRNTQFWDGQFLGFGARCVEVVGETDVPTGPPKR